MSLRLERVIEIGEAVAGSLGQRDIVELITNPTKQQLGIDRLTSEVLVPDPRQKLPSDLHTSGRLLPAYQVIPFRFREDERSDYLDWCGQSKTLAVRLITGDSGRGKTRLMMELAGALRDNGPVHPGRTTHIWTSGFVNLETLQRLSDDHGGDPFEVPFAAKRDLCLIVDYAENRPNEVTQLLKAAVAAIDDGRLEKIRIVLIARQHTEVFHTILQDPNLIHRQSIEFRDNALSPVANPEDFFQHACEALSVPDAFRVFPEGLKSETPDCGILSLAALLAVEETIVTGSQDAILDKVLVHEKRYWKATAQRLGVSELLLNQNAHEIVAANLTFYGLQGAIHNVEEGAKLVTNIPLLADQDHSVRRALVKSIADLYPHPDGRIEGVGLDLLADHLVATMVDNISVGQLSSAQLRSALTRITWIARRTIEPAQKLLNKLLTGTPEMGLAAVLELAPAVGDPLGRLAAEWLEVNPIDPNHARKLEQGLPEQTVTLREFAVVVTRNALLDRNTLTEKQQASIVNNLANRLSELGQGEAALAAAQEAVTLYRKLAETRPDAFAPYLATSLHTLANRLSELGQREAALEAVQEAVTLLRKLAEAQPDAFVPDLAMSLNNRASMLSELGQREAALEAAQEAVTLLRKLPKARRPDAFASYLATSLHSLANRLSDLGQREAALEAAQEAVTLCRKLAKVRPDAFVPNLAIFLNDYATKFSELGKHEAALAAAQEAVTLYRKLAETRPDAFAPYLATSLGALSQTLTAQGHHIEAEKALHESITVLSPLFLNAHAVFGDLMTSLLRNYIKACEVQKHELDMELLAPLITAFDLHKEKAT